MASSSSAPQASVKEYVVRVPKTNKKRYHMMRFNSDLGTDFFKTWTNCKLERENNLKEYRFDDDMPKFGAGSEFGREQREEARRKKYGINVKKYKSEDQPWLLNIGGKSGKKFKGIREGGVADNVSWYVFMQGKDGAFEAYPVDEWYNFQPIQRYKALSAEEAEEEFVRRDKIMNYFQVMFEKKFRKDNGEVEEEEGGGGKKKGKKSLMLSEMDDWVSDSDEDEDDKNDDEADDEGEDSKKKKPKKGAGRKKATGGKKKRQEGGESEDSCLEESDDYNEGVEHDYISSDSSDSELENAEKVTKELTGVEEGDALKKLLASDEEDEDQDENKDKDKEEEEKKNEDETEDKEKKKKKKKKKDKKSDKDSEESSCSSSDESKKKKGSKNPDRKDAVNELKRKVKENPLEMPESKRMRMDNSGLPTGSGAGAIGAADSMEDAIRRYLMRKPMTTTELLKIFKKKKDMSSEQLVTSIAQILKRVNPVKRMIKGKMYLSLKTS